MLERDESSGQLPERQQCSGMTISIKKRKKNQENEFLYYFVALKGIGNINEFKI